MSRTYSVWVHGSIDGGPELDHPGRLAMYDNPYEAWEEVILGEPGTVVYEVAATETLDRRTLKRVDRSGESHELSHVEGDRILREVTAHCDCGYRSVAGDIERAHQLHDEHRLAALAEED